MSVNNNLTSAGSGFALLSAAAKVIKNQPHEHYPERELLRTKIMLARLCILCAISFLSGCDSKNIYDAKSAVEDKMKDPDSVKFQNIEEFSEDIVCGEYNAKNGYGAYGGYESFISKNGIVDLDFKYQKWELLCSNDKNKMNIYYYVTRTKVCSETGEKVDCDLAKAYADNYKHENPGSELPSLSEWSDLEL